MSSAIPHPAYASQGWVSVVCAGTILPMATTLLQTAYARAQARHHTRVERQRG